MSDATSALRRRLQEAILAGGACRDLLERLAGVYLELPRDVRIVLGPELHAAFGDSIAAILAAAERRGEVRPVGATLVTAAFCASLATEPNPTEPVVDMLWRGLAAEPA